MLILHCINSCWLISFKIVIFMILLTKITSQISYRRLDLPSFHLVSYSSYQLFYPCNLFLALFTRDSNENYNLYIYTVLDPLLCFCPVTAVNFYEHLSVCYQYFALNQGLYCEKSVGYYLICTILFMLQVGQLREVSNKVHNAELKLFLEVELGLVMIFLVVYGSCFLVDCIKHDIF